MKASRKNLPGSETYGELFDGLETGEAGRQQVQEFRDVATGAAAAAKALAAQRKALADQQEAERKALEQQRLIDEEKRKIVEEKTKKRKTDFKDDRVKKELKHDESRLAKRDRHVEGLLDKETDEEAHNAVEALPATRRAEMLGLTPQGLVVGDSPKQGGGAPSEDEALIDAAGKAVETECGEGSAFKTKAGHLQLPSGARLSLKSSDTAVDSLVKEKFRKLRRAATN